jgi:hypothetical protein
MPELVALRLDAVPAEPPVDHLSSSVGEVCQDGHMTGPIREMGVTRLQRKIPGIEQAIDVLPRQNVVSVGGSVLQRSFNVFW